MAPTPLSTKGGGTLARKWRKIKKRCASFSSGDAVGTGMARSKSMVVASTEAGVRKEAEEEEEDAGFDNGPEDEEKYSSVGSRDASKFQHLRTKINNWNAELRRRRRSSQGDSVSQWWHWNGSGSRDSTPAGSRATVARSSSLKGVVGRKQQQGRDDWGEEDEDDDEVFVTADPIRGGAQGGGVTVKSAMIVSATNPYCTGVRVHKRRGGSKSKGLIVGEWESATTTATSTIVSVRPSPSPQQQQQQPQQPASSLGSPPSPPVSDDASETAASSSGSACCNASSTSSVGHHDQHSGYDGYCPSPSAPNAASPEKSVASSSYSEEVSLPSSEESHYGNAVSIAAGRRNRPQSVYEKQYGPVQHCLERETYSNGHVSRATVVSLVSSSSSNVVVSSSPQHHRQHQRRDLPPVPSLPRRCDSASVPPPLPPRPMTLRAPSQPPPPPPPAAFEDCSPPARPSPTSTCSLPRNSGGKRARAARKAQLALARRSLHAEQLAHQVDVDEDNREERENEQGRSNSNLKVTAIKKLHVY